MKKSPKPTNGGTKSKRTQNGNYYIPYSRMTEEQRQKIRDNQRRKREENKNNTEWQLKQAQYYYNHYKRKIEELKAKLQRESMK